MHNTGIHEKGTDTKSSVRWKWLLDRVQADAQALLMHY